MEADKTNPRAEEAAADAALGRMNICYVCGELHNRCQCKAGRERAAKNSLCARCGGKKQFAVVGKTECQGKLYTLIPIVFDNRAEAESEMDMQKRFGDSVASVVPANHPHRADLSITLRVLWIRVKAHYQESAIVGEARKAVRHARELINR